MSAMDDAVSSGTNRTIATCRDGQFLVDPRDVYIGRSLLEYGEFSPAEGALYRALLGPGDVVIDAGAHIGSFTLLFSRQVGEQGRVYAFEPQRLIFQMLCANLALNSVTNVEAWPAALGADLGQMTVPPYPADAPYNSGGLALCPDGPGETVPVSAIDNLGLADCALIKADVQGMERDVIAGAADTIERCRPLLYLENDQRELSPALLRHLDQIGYRAFWHTPALFAAENHNRSNRDLFPNVVNVNLLCLPAGVRITFPGLREVTGPDSWWRDA